MAQTTTQKQASPAKELPPCAETVARDSDIGKFVVKFGYAYLIILNVVVFFYDNVPISLQILSTSIVCIILGSFASLRHPESADAQEVERMKPKDAYMFPVFGSCALCSFYCAIKYLPAYIIDIAAQIFFMFMSTFAVQALFIDLFFLYLPSFIMEELDVHLFSIVIKWKNMCDIPSLGTVFIPMPSFKTNQVNQSKKNEDVFGVTCCDLIAFMFGAFVAFLWYELDQHWFFNNIIGISLSIQAVGFLNPGSYYTATVLLSLLFFYDIFWVFGTDVMVTVAKNLKAPIKLVFPRPAVVDKPNMLGLGDIVLPGIYIALILRYDVMRTFAKINFNNVTVKNMSNLPSLNMNTFYVVLVCYILSLCGCLVTMWIFKAAQPALLYIVPGVILPVMMFTKARGDFNNLWTYDEEPENEKIQKKKD